MTCYVQNCTVTFSFFAENDAAAAAGRRHARRQLFSHDQFIAIARHGICTEYAPWRFHAIVLRVRGRQEAQQRQQATAAETGLATGAATAATTTTTTTTTTALLFRSGRVVLTGVRGSHLELWREIRRAAYRVRRRVQMALQAGDMLDVAGTLGIYRLTTRNLVSTVRLPHRVAIEQVYDTLRRCRMRIAPEDADRVAGFVAVRRCCLDLCTFPALRCTLLMASPAGEEQEVADEVPNTQQQQQQQLYRSVTCLVFTSGRVIVTGVRHIPQLLQALRNITSMLTHYVR
uniref:TATA-box binding protein n=1 Tax=Globodera pallida TaxID=36090 RepID=A0A183BN38_GLOPA